MQNRAIAPGTGKRGSN